MVRDFSEEKRQEIFRLLDEIDMKDWKSFMEWCGSRKEEFGDWPDKLSVSAYTRYVDQYHKKVLEINEMTRQQVNTVFENVAEIDARYAARMREHREKVKEQIAIVKTMTEFMDSMANGNPNMALLSVPTVNENRARVEDDEEDEKEENTEPEVIKWEDICPPNQKSIIDEAEGQGIIGEPEVAFMNQLMYYICDSNIEFFGRLDGLDALYDKGLISEENYNCLMDIHEQVNGPGDYDVFVLKEQARNVYTEIERVIAERTTVNENNYDDAIINRPIWYGKPMQIEGGDSDGEQYLTRRIEENSNLRNSWSQEKTDQLWASCEQIYDKYGIAIDPRFLLAIIIQEGTGSFNTSSANPAADGGNGPHSEYELDLKNASDLILGKTLGYIFYNDQFREVADNNSDLLENSTANIFTYCSWKTPIIDLNNDCVRIGVYANDYKWGANVKDIYESLTYKGAGEEYNNYILSIEQSAVQDIIQGIVIREFTFLADGNGVNYLNEHCGAYTIIAEESD